VLDAVRHVCQACRFGSGPKYNLQIAPLINIRVKKAALATLEEGLIPPSSPVIGEGVWETVFGKPAGTAGWTWGDLIEGVLQTEAWEYQLATMMAEAIKWRSVQYPSIGVRISIRGVEGKNDIYRIGLRRVSEYEQDFEFAFVLSRIRTPFEPSESDRETMLYHLFNLAWHFRRRFIEHHKRKMEDLADLQESYQRSGRKEEFESELHDAVRSLSVDLKALEADAQVRGIDRSMQVRRAYAIAERENLDRFLNVEFPPLIKRLNEAIRSTTPDPRAIRDLLAAMDPINKWFCQTSLRELTNVAERGDE
jgi:hypothetical protein